MAFSKTLPADVLKVIAGDIGARLQPTPDHINFIGPGLENLPQSSLNVGESFEVWKLTPDALEEIAYGNREIEALTRRSGLWHHQIRRNGEAIGFARSKPFAADAESWSVRDIFISEMAKKIDEAITYVDKYIEEDVEARLLSIPIQQVEAFWFVSGDSSSHKVLIISTSDRIREFEALKEMSSEDFLAALVTKQHGMGVRSGSRSAPTISEKKGVNDMATKKGGKGSRGGGKAGGPKSSGGGAGGGKRSTKAGPGKAGGPKSTGGGAGGGKRSAKKK